MLQDMVQKVSSQIGQSGSSQEGVPSCGSLLPFTQRSLLLIKKKSWSVQGLGRERSVPVCCRPVEDFHKQRASKVETKYCKKQLHESLVSQREPCVALRGSSHCRWIWWFVAFWSMGRVWETASDTLNAIMRQCHKIAACCRVQLGALSDFQHGHEASRGGETVLATCQFSHNLPVSL